MIGIFLVASASASDLNETAADDLGSFNDENEISLDDSANSQEDLGDDKLSQTENPVILSTNYTPDDANQLQSHVNNAKDGDNIILDGNYILNSTINVNKRLNFIGVNNAVVDGLSCVRLFTVNVNGVIFKNITFKNGCSSEGGAIYSKNDFTVENCSFINNSATASSWSYGGGAMCGGNAVNCIFINNTADEAGGAMRGGSAVDCIFEGNYARYGHGGAINNGNARNCIFRGNRAGFQSGGAMSGGSALNCTFINNFAKYGGGAVYDGSVVNCTFIYNSAETCGGAAYFYSKGSVVNCTFINNTADGAGGAVAGGSALDCTFMDNHANKGGAVSSVSAVNCSFNGNSASNGGAMNYGSAVNCSFNGNIARNNGGAMSGGSAVNCSFVGNSAKNYGGAIACDSYDANKYNVTNCIFGNNHADNGGAIYLVKAINCTFIENYANYDGGAVYNTIVVNSTFVNNSATDEGGAIYGDNNEILNCNFINNTAKNGGAVFQVVTLNCNFNNNHATENGGAMHDGYAINCTFNENHANNNGGAISNSIVAVSTFEYNAADNNGGAIDGGKATNCIFNNNHADNYGGAASNAEISLSSQFKDNDASVENDCYNVDYFTIENTFTDLEKLFDNDYSEIYIDHNYTFEFGLDYYLKEGIVINRNVTVYGNGLTLNGIGISRIFSVRASNVIFKDLIFVNGFAKSDGGAINGECVAENCIFANNSGGAVSRCNAFNCLFTDNSGSAMIRGRAINCSFVNNSGRALNGGYRYDESYAENCTFTNNPEGAMKFGHAVNCTFIGNSAESGAAIYEGSALDCTFIGNSATGLGGAVYGIDAVNCLFINNSNTYTGYYSDYGGGAMNRGSARNCTFINNVASKYGGAISCNFNIENCTFINNSARYGGAINCWDNVKDCVFINNSDTTIEIDRYEVTIRNCTFINNVKAVSDSNRHASMINCTFIDNDDLGSACNSINCTFINNHCYLRGSADNCRFINNSGSALSWGSATNCIFINNSGSNGGAMYDCGSAVNCIFIGNSATGQGGAIFEVTTVKNCTFINNSAERGGAIKGSSNSGPPYYTYYFTLVENCTFINNSATYGGASSAAANVVDCIFIDNSATFGGSIYGTFEITYYIVYGGTRSLGTYHTNVTNCTFINSSAIYGGAMYDGNALNCTFINSTADWGGAVYLENNMTITYCEFINCSANIKGGAIYINQSGTVTYCTFTGCTSGEDNSCLAVNASQSNYTVLNCIFDEYPVNVNYHYVSSLIANNLTYFNGEEGIVIANLSDIRGVLDSQIVFIIIGDEKYNVTTDLKGMAYFNIPDYLNKAGIYNATVSYEGDNIINPSSFNVTITINKHDSILNVPELVLYKNEYGILIGNLNNVRGPLANKTIVFRLDGVNYRRTTDQNGVVEFNVLNYLDGRGKFDLNVTFEGDDFNHPAKTNVSVYIIDFRGILTCSVDGKYFNDTLLMFSLINYKNNKPIFNAPLKLVFSNGEVVNLTTDVDGAATYRMPFKPGTYDVTACVDQEYVDVNNVSIDGIEINKIFGQISHELLNGNKTLMLKLFNSFNLDVFRNVKIDLAFNNGETAEITTNDAGVAVYDLPFPKGTYSVSVMVNGEYKQFEDDYIDNIVVKNDLNASINFTNGIVFDFGEYGSTNFTVDGGIVEYANISVIGHPEAIIGLSNNTISVSYLSVGKYTLLVDVTPDDYHNGVNGTVNITVNNVKSKVTLKTGVVFEYGGSSSLHVTVDGGIVERKNIRILNHPEAKIGLSGQVITISGLKVGNYILSVTSTPDSDHTEATSNVTVTVKKAPAVISASKVTVALKSGTLWVIKIVEFNSKKPIANMKITLKVYTGKKFITVNLKTNSKGEASYQTKKLSKGTHRVVVSATHSEYNFNTLTSSIKVIKPKALKFKLKKKVDDDDGSLRSYLVLNKKTKKGVNGVKVKVLIYTGKKYKTYTFKTKKIKGNKKTYNGAFGFATNKFSVGKHKVKIMPASIKYKGSAKTTIKITKKARKGPKYMREI